MGPTRQRGDGLAPSLDRTSNRYGGDLPIGVLGQPPAMQLGDLLQAMLAIGGPKNIQTFGGLGLNRTTSRIHQAIQSRGNRPWTHRGIGSEVVLQFGHESGIVAAALTREQVR